MASQRVLVQKNNWNGCDSYYQSARQDMRQLLFLKTEKKLTTRADQNLWFHFWKIKISMISYQFPSYDISFSTVLEKIFEKWITWSFANISIVGRWSNFIGVLLELIFCRFEVKDVRFSIWRHSIANWRATFHISFWTFRSCSNPLMYRTHRFSSWNFFCIHCRWSRR